MTPPITIVERTARVGILGHLDELERLMREFLDEMETRGHATVYGADSLTDWKFETFLQWLRQRQRESVAAEKISYDYEGRDPMYSAGES